jgi:hypothetical protein
MSGVKSFILFTSFLAWVSLGQAAFVSTGCSHHVPTRDSSQKLKADEHLESRRTMLQDIALTSFGLASGLVFQKDAANASGGATAGGAYLLSAKQRYNERVTKGIKGFLALRPTLEAGSIEETKAYFTDEEAGTWKDISTAGYLLANAFRRSSNTAPDSLPSVKVRKLLLSHFCFISTDFFFGLEMESVRWRNRYRGKVVEKERCGRNSCSIHEGRDCAGCLP